MYEPLHHKYRPQTFAQLVGQGAIATTLTNALQQNRIAPAYLFCGPRGTGKTSSARILAKSLNCLQSESPTPAPCGVCDVCRSVTRGNALDVVEIDAASNTGVDNIRELIERSQFAPVQCRYKVYVIDECLTGDTQVTTDSGQLRIDDPSIVGTNVLSYNEKSATWEYRAVTRRFDQGKRQIYTIETARSKIKCTGNHLIRTETGWVAAKDIKEGMRILSPANVGVAPPSSSSAPMDASVDLLAAINSRGTGLVKKPMTSVPSLKLWNPTGHYVPVVVENGSKSLLLCGRKDMASKGFALAGKSIPTDQSMVFGSNELKTLFQIATPYPQTAWASFTELCWETVPSAFQIRTADFQGLPGRMENPKQLGWSTKQADCLICVHPFESSLTEDTETSRYRVTQLAILSLLKFFKSSSQKLKKNKFLFFGWISSRSKALLGGTWTTEPFNLQRKVAHVSSSIQKDFAWREIASSLAGYQRWDTQPRLKHTQKQKLAKLTHTSLWEWRHLGSFWQTSGRTLFPQWHTNLEVVKSIRLGGFEPVYDIEVADNHNFVANGLLVHNCHMLSTAAFNALLKTLEEPPDRVVFVLATTDPQRVLPTIISRCQRFDFRRIPLPAMIKHLSYIAEQESIQIAEAAIQLVAQISQGGLRDAESLLDQLSLQADEITIEAVWDLVGAVPERDLLNLVRAIAADDSTALLERTRHLMDKGREPLIVLQSLVGFYRDLLIAKSAPARIDMVAITPPTWAEMTAFAQKLSAAQLLASQQKLQTAEVQVKNTTQPRLWLEITLTGLLPSALGAVAQQATGGVYSARSVLSVANPPAVAPTITPSEQIVRQPVDLPPDTPTTPPAVQPSEQTSKQIEKQASSPNNEPSNLPAQPADVCPANDNASPAEPIEVVFGTLDDLWTKILAALAPRGTQMLMSQQGMLIRFDGVGATVGFRSPTLQKMARDRIPNLEAAFKAVFQRPIKVSLEVLKAEDSDGKKSEQGKAQPPHQFHPAPPVKDSKPSAAPSPSQNHPSPSSPPDRKPSDEQNLHSQSAKSPSEETNGYKPPTPSESPIPKTPFPPLPPQNSALPSAGLPTDQRPDQWAVNQDQDSIKRFAQFFNGQIVDLDDADDLASRSDDSSEQQRSQKRKSSDPGPDVPF